MGEIGFVSIRKTNFVIRVAHHLFATELTEEETSPTDEELDKIKDKSERDVAIMKPYKNHCRKLFTSNRGPITDIIFEHYNGLDKKKFSLRYHQEYPKEKNQKKLHNKDVYKDLLGQNKNASTNFDELDNPDLTAAERKEIIERRKRIEKYKRLQKLAKYDLEVNIQKPIGSQALDLESYRMQRADGHAIIVKEMARMKKEKKKKS